MEPSSTALVRVSTVRTRRGTTERRLRPYSELNKRETIILREFIKHTLMIGQPITQISQSINELLSMFCGPIEKWRLPKVLNILILELADIARVGVRSLRFTINNSPRSERIFMWNAKRWHAKNANRARRNGGRSENPAPGTST